ncbi:hypothetical protein C8J57DRAFT_1229094 [Mycena rebaudengoi]|nr:hypothetical protein C8J57DRAFT_1229094 [Mycena rebaudengoi]
MCWGALILHELGMVMDLHAGDMVLFLSAQLTHFNLHFQGIRASLVFHTDNALKLWDLVNKWDGEYGVQKEGAEELVWTRWYEDRHCARLKVPLDYSNPHSESAAIAMCCHGSAMAGSRAEPIGAGFSQLSRG